MMLSKSNANRLAVHLVLPSFSIVVAWHCLASAASAIDTAAIAKPSILAYIGCAHALNLYLARRCLEFFRVIMPLTLLTISSEYLGVNMVAVVRVTLSSAIITCRLYSSITGR